MRHHDAHVVQRDGFFSRRAVKELTVSDGATVLPTLGHAQDLSLIHI